MSVEKIIQEALDQNPLGLKEAFEEEIKRRVALALEAKKSEMEKDDEDEDEDDEDEDEDEDDLDEATVVEVMEALIEAAEEEGLELSEEELVELSKETLSSYIKKKKPLERKSAAGKELTKSKWAARKQWNDDKKAGVSHKEREDRYDRHLDDIDRKASKVHKGTDLAQRKLDDKERAERAAKAKAAKTPSSSANKLAKSKPGTKAHHDAYQKTIWGG